MIPYYNIINIVKFNDNFLKDIASVISILDTLIHYMCRNHKIYGWNCGETYFPYEKKGNAIYSKLPGWQSNRSEVDKLILQNILSEIGQFMNTNERDLRSSIDFRGDGEIKDSLENGSVTNIYINND